MIEITGTMRQKFEEGAQAFECSDWITDGIRAVLEMPEVQEMLYYEHMDRIEGAAEMNAQSRHDEEPF